MNASVPPKHDNNGNGGGGDGDGGSGDGGTSGGSTSVPSGVPTLTSASESSSGTVLPPFYMSTDEERAAIKALSKEMPVFHGGSKAPSEWPSFWSRISSILRFSTYTPGGPLVTTPENANNSHRLYLLLTLKLGSPADLPFLDNPEYVGHGFEMLARLQQTYAPSQKSDLYSNFVGLVFLEQGPTDSVEYIASRIRHYAAMLAAGGWRQEPILLTMVLMKALDDRYDALKSDFSLNPEIYAVLTVDQLEQRILKWAASRKVLSSSDPSLSASAAAAATKPRGLPASDTPAKPTASSSSPDLTTELITARVKEGRCVCSRRKHKLPDCLQFLKAGFVITSDPAKAKERLAEVESKHKKLKASASAAAPPPPTTPSGDTSAPTGTASHVTTTPNRFAALDSDDDEDGFDQDVGVSYATVAGKAKSASALYLTASSLLSHSTCVGSSSHVAVLPVGSASNVTTPSVVIADSGATDHMWHDYNAFTSYRPTSSQHVLLADNTKAPVAGIGSIKIILDGHVCGLRNVLHVPSLRVPLYSLRAHRRMKGCGFIGDNGRFQVYFPSFVTTVDDSSDSYIPYSPLGRASPCFPGPQHQNHPCQEWDLPQRLLAPSS